MATKKGDKERKRERDVRDKTDTKHKRSNTRLTQTEKNPILLLGVTQTTARMSWLRLDCAPRKRKNG